MPSKSWLVDDPDEHVEYWFVPEAVGSIERLGEFYCRAAEIEVMLNDQFPTGFSTDIRLFGSFFSPTGVQHIAWVTPWSKDGDSKHRFATVASIGGNPLTTLVSIDDLLDAVDKMPVVVHKWDRERLHLSPYLEAQARTKVRNDILAACLREEEPYGIGGQWKLVRPLNDGELIIIEKLELPVD